MSLRQLFSIRYPRQTIFLLLTLTCVVVVLVGKTRLQTWKSVPVRQRPVWREHSSQTDVKTEELSEFFLSESQCSPDSQRVRKNAIYGFNGPFNYLPNYKNPCYQDGDRVRCLPYFMIVGSYKCASKDLFNRIKKHPQVADIEPTGQKENWWLVLYRFNQRHTRGFGNFTKFYEDNGKVVQNRVEPGTGFHRMVLGDSTPINYVGTRHWQLIPENDGCPEPRVTSISQIHRLLPKARLILILRNPVTRLYSDYLFHAPMTKAKMTPDQFDAWVKEARDKLLACKGIHPERRCLYDVGYKRYTEINKNDPKVSVAAGIYVRYISDLLKVYPRNQVYFVQNEDYQENMVNVMRDVYKFLDLDPLSDAELQEISRQEKRNTGSNYDTAGDMWNSTRALLRDFYAPYNRELSQLLKDKKFLWLEP